MKRFVLGLLSLLLVVQPTPAAFVSFQVNSGVVSGCTSGVLDANAASPGAYTAAYSHRKLRSAYAGDALQLTRTSDSTTLEVGFTSCDPNTTPTTTFCSTATLTVGTTSSTRVAFPSGSVIYAFNKGPSAIFYAVGNSGVTATTSSTALSFRQGAQPITVGADTHIAAIIGTGYGTNGGTGSAELFLTNCGVTAVYDQSGNSHNMAQIVAGAANRMGYVPNGQGSLPLIFGCLSNCGLKAADSATYKTSTINTFTVMTFGEDITTSSFFYNSIGYPTTTSSDATHFRWGLVNVAFQDLLANAMNDSVSGNAEGFGGIWRGQNLTQYDYSSGGITRWNGGTQFMNQGGGTPTYPNAVGLYLMGDAAGNGTPGTWAEAIVASGTQTARDTISANQVSYWGITQGAANASALTNPLGDGFNWSRIQIGSFAPNPPGPGRFTVNGSTYASESSWNDYSQWRATNALSTGGRLGDLWRFQLTGRFDVWDGTNRSELDGSTSATCAQDVDCWYSWAVWVEPGTAYTASWVITGQNHTFNAGLCCTFLVNFKNDQFIFSTLNASTQTDRYTSPTTTRATWYHIVIKMRASSSGSGDTFEQWSDFVTPGTMVKNINASGALFPAANTSSYWKYGVYQETGAPRPALAVRYGNMQMCTQGSDCTSKYGVSDLSALTTTPLANPSN